MKLPDFEGGGTQEGRHDQRSPPRLVRLAKRDRANSFLMLAVGILTIAGGLFLAVSLADLDLE